MNPWKIAFTALCIQMFGESCAPPRPQTEVALNQTPPTVRAAFWLDYPDATIQRLMRITGNGQYFYDFEYTDSAGKQHRVEMNSAGDQIDSSD